MLKTLVNIVMPMPLAGDGLFDICYANHFTIALCGPVVGFLDQFANLLQPLYPEMVSPEIAKAFVEAANANR